MDWKSILNKAGELEPDLIRTRRWLHRNPELSFKEKKTTEFIADRLRKIGLHPVTFPDYFGLYADLFCGGEKEPMVVLRADIDALPVKEETGLPFASQTEGVMHACGHDCHTAMLLTAAEILAGMRNELHGRIRFLFQSAEESCHGAAYYIDHGILNGASVIFGEHVWSELSDQGINLEDGARMASCDNFTIKVHGKTAHGASPERGIDAIAASSAIVQNLQQIVSRRIDPRDSAAITIGTIHGGERSNLICKEVVMEGTVRTHSESVRDSAEDWIRRCAEYSAEGTGAEAELDYQYILRPLFNDPKYTTAAREAVAGLFGTSVLMPMKKSMLSEDFSLYQERIPSVFALVGARNEKKGLIYGNHDPRFTVDESILKRGAALYAGFAADVLQEQEY